MPDGLKYQIAKEGGEVEVGVLESDGYPTQVVGFGSEVATLVEVAAEDNRLIEHGRRDVQ